MQDGFFKTEQRRLIEEALEAERSEFVCCWWHTQSSGRKGLPERLLGTVDTPEERASCCEDALFRAFLLQE